MAAKFDRCDVIILCGPPFAVISLFGHLFNAFPEWPSNTLLKSYQGKSRFYTNNLQLSHRLVSPSSVFKQHPNFGLRDISLQILKLLKKCEKVVVDDENASQKTRTSYVTLVRKKSPNTSLGVVEILPQYGCPQLYWAREFWAAEASFKGHATERDEGVLTDASISKWFNSEIDKEVTYRIGVVDKPVKQEHASLHHISLPLTAASAFKLEVPALFIQWECLSSLLRDGKLSVGNVCKALKHWISSNVCGRVLIVCDGSEIRTGERSRSQLQSEIQTCTKQLVSKFSEAPVYVFLVESPDQAGRYVLPPRPGLLAYLQRQHCLDIHSKSTMYLYESTNHMKMAEAAGVSHIKGSRVLEHPSLVVSSHAAVIPSIPAMLQDLKVVEDMDSGQENKATIPLYNLSEQFRDNCVSASLGYGRREYLYATDWDVVLRYQTQYESLASRVDETGSKIRDLIETSTAQNKTGEKVSQLHSSASVTVARAGSKAHSELPKWMLGKSASGSSNSSLESSRSDSTASTSVKVRKTVYVMTEKELAETAVEILKQAGKEDLVRSIQAQQKTGAPSPSKVKSDTDSESTTKAIDTHVHEPNITVATGYVVMATEHKEDGTGRSPRAAKESPLLKADVAKPVRVITEAHRETVADILEDFSCQPTTRIKSPKKKARHKRADSSNIDITQTEEEGNGEFISRLLDNTFRDNETVLDGLTVSPRKRTRVDMAERSPAHTATGVKDRHRTEREHGEVVVQGFKTPSKTDTSTSKARTVRVSPRKVLQSDVLKSHARSGTETPPQSGGQASTADRTGRQRKSVDTSILDELFS